MFSSACHSALVKRVVNPSRKGEFGNWTPQTIISDAPVFHSEPHRIQSSTTLHLNRLVKFNSIKQKKGKKEKNKKKSRHIENNRCTLAKQPHLYKYMGKIVEETITSLSEQKDGSKPRRKWGLLRFHILTLSLSQTQINSWFYCNSHLFEFWFRVHKMLRRNRESRQI